MTRDQKVHLRHCFQGDQTTCKYGEANCPAMPTTQPTEQTEDKKGKQFRNIIETLRSQLTLRQIMIIQLGYQDALEEARQDGALRERKRIKHEAYKRVEWNGKDKIDVGWISTIELEEIFEDTPEMESE